MVLSCAAGRGAGATRILMQPSDIHLEGGLLCDSSSAPALQHVRFPGDSFFFGS